MFGENALDCDDYAHMINRKALSPRRAALIDPDKVMVGGRVRRENAAHCSPRCWMASRPDDAVMQEEIFGPVLPVHRL